MIEMVVPSSLDPTIAPPGGHVVLLFTQYTPYKLADGEWDEAAKDRYADTGETASQKRGIYQVMHPFFLQYLLPDSIASPPPPPKLSWFFSLVCLCNGLKKLTICMCYSCCQKSGSFFYECLSVTFCLCTTHYSAPY